MDHILEVRNVSLQFGGVKALDDVSYHINKGEIFSLIGPNGAGKTSMLNCISGLYRPSNGEIRFEGKNILGMKPYKRTNLGIARAFQNIALFAHMSVLDNLKLGRHILMKSGPLSGGIYWGKAAQEEVYHRRAVEEVIDFLELQEIRHTPVGTLPYGLQKRVEVGRALALEPKLILLDEPMAGMNNAEKEMMARFILDMHELKEMTVVLIEHDLGVVMNLSDHIAVLDFGKQIGFGTPKEIQHNPEVIKAYIGEEEVG
ncbi:ABC transporter ATP-binding protein [Halalkalibacter nanhaiisediminis]|uniref:Branched-chain amino acid transport system ATP-binding protein n=1 Tax=Halalkalibacter nanhaiisediminis TaxID=688079 RepID=A0A562QQC3_9BACI|nr:ABC transporter ATP-binding protein [Halalkalibacter nanhaiisediminis]TWI58873.1 branched-chain amino acid transport system ATP-binding protein [Halalkalibacter nanhaiisediminis]